MPDGNHRSFEATSRITGEVYRAEFRWLQTAISLRHSDTVDVKFLVNGAAKTVALPHGALERACGRRGIPLRDDLCIRLAAAHLRRCLESGEDAEKELITLTDERIEDLLGQL